MWASGGGCAGLHMPRAEGTQVVSRGRQRVGGGACTKEMMSSRAMYEGKFCTQIIGEHSTGGSSSELLWCLAR